MVEHINKERPLLRMRNPLYRYNVETCQYERVRVSAAGIASYLSGVIVLAIVVLVGMLVLHDYFFDSRKELTLRKENAALKQNHVILTSQLNTIESTLEHLDAEDKKLHAKFFGPSAADHLKDDPHQANKKLLLADAAVFRNAVDAMRLRSSVLLTQAGKTSAYFGHKLQMAGEQKSKLSAMPLLQPVQPWDSNDLLSGFGMRINPFHKGLYEHPGVDIAMPRGSDVVATASGKVIEIKRSDVQAGYGNCIVIDHGHGFVTRYAHLEEIRVKHNQKVVKGSVIATVGSSGGSIAPHLHYEIIRDGVTIDPVHFMIEGLTSDEHHHLTLISQKQNQSLD